MQKEKNSFREIYQRLNQGQRKAVDTIEGPVLVIAGPGTGKTEILAARIANILLSTDAAPENILCLTYTDAGTVAMRSRLLQFIGSDAYRVDIFTFHSFCNMVIQEEADQFGLKNLTAISELEQFQFMREIIDSFPAEHPLTRSTGDLYFEADRLLNLYEIMKKEDISSSWLIGKIDSYAASLPDSPDFLYKRTTKDGDGTIHKKGDLNKKKLKDELMRLEQLKGAATSFDQYQKLLKERSRYDFADMILWCIEAFGKNSDLLARYQERYLYLLVDEFQDTNGSQFDLLMQLADYWDAPNLFVVGDDDQSIFRFQGASVENIRRFASRYQGSLTTVTLTENHRSSQKILDAAASLIRRNSERFSSDKQLVAKNMEVADLPEPPSLTGYANITQETAAVAEGVIRLLDEGARPEQIAVIYRNHRQSEELIRYLTAKGAPVQCRRRVDILKEPLIEKLLLLLNYLAGELEKPHSCESMLFQILHEPWFDIPPLTLARLSVETGRRRNITTPCHWREQLQLVGVEKGQQQLFPDKGEQNLRLAGEGIEDLLRNAAVMPLQELIHHVITKLGILSAALSSQDRIWQMELLNSLFDFIKDESEKGGLTLPVFLSMLEDMKQQGIALPAEKLSYSGNGVNFLTAHGSKGLQFDYLFMLGCNNNVWDKPPRSRTYRLPPTIWEGVTGSEEEESRRLFYVAMTRARKRLMISWGERDNNEKEMEMSRYVAELMEGNLVNFSTAQLPDETLIEFGCNLLRSTATSLPESFVDPHLVESILEKYSLSVTHLNSYLRCPVSFYFNTLLKVPSPMNAALGFGSAVHYALEQQFRKMKNHPASQFPGVTVFLDDFRWYMERHRTSFNQTEFRRRLEYGARILPAYHAARHGQWKHNVLVEYPYRNILVEGVPINGKLDLLELSGNHVTVVDYKTGNPANARKKLKPPEGAKGGEGTVEQLLGGDYWRQAVFYRILVENEPGRNRVMSAVRFEFVEPERDSLEFKTKSFTVSDQEVELVMGQITDVYGKIKRMEFENGCNQQDCEWCSFVKRFSGTR